MKARQFQRLIEQLGELTPEQRQALAKGWIETVQTRLKADAVREELDAYIISRAARVQ